ncbi:hypothetical protein FKM82_023564 [Ascaphus truei]
MRRPGFGRNHTINKASTGEQLPFKDPTRIVGQKTCSLPGRKLCNLSQHRNFNPQNFKWVFPRTDTKRVLHASDIPGESDSSPQNPPNKSDFSGYPCFSTGAEAGISLKPDLLVAREDWSCPPLG